MNKPDPRAELAETYLILLQNTTESRHAGQYVRLARDYGIPHDRIITLSGLTTERINELYKGHD